MRAWSIIIVKLAWFCCRSVIARSSSFCSASRFSKSLLRLGLATIPVCWLSLTFSNCFFLSLVVSSASYSLAFFSSSSRSLSFVPCLSFCFRINWYFSRLCDRMITFATILARSLESSSLRSSIFSLSVWFSIFNYSKSIKCRPSASCSFLRSTFSWFWRRFLSAIFCSRYWWTS